MSQSTDLVFVAVTSSMSLYNDGNTVFIIKNAGGAPITATVNSLELCSQGLDHDVDVIVTNAEERACGPYDQSRFNDGVGHIQITFSAITSVTIASIYANK